MRKKNPKYMKEIINFVDQFYPRHGRSPSCTEIAAHTTLNRSAVHNYLVAMNDEGMIEYNGQTILTPNTRAGQQEMRRIGIVGSVSCGLPTDATVEQGEYMNLPMTMVGNDDLAGWRKGYRYTVSAITLDIANKPALSFNMLKATMVIPSMKTA